MKTFKQFKKTIAVLAVAGLLVVSAAALAGCGSSSGSSSSSSSSSASSSAATSSSSSTISLKDLESQMTEAYMGVTDAGEGFYYAASAKGDLCIVMAVDAKGNTVSFVGPATVSGDTITVTDVVNGMALTFQVVPQNDGTILLDMGTTGKAIIAPCSVSDVLTVMQGLDTYGNAVA